MKTKQEASLLRRTMATRGNGYSATLKTHLTSSENYQKKTLQGHH